MFRSIGIRVVHRPVHMKTLIEILIGTCPPGGRLIAALRSHGLPQPALVAPAWSHTPVAHEHVPLYEGETELPCLAGILAWLEQAEPAGRCHMYTTVRKAELGVSSTRQPNQTRPLLPTKAHTLQAGIQ